MNKKLPGVFANNISADAAHNKNVSYGLGEDKINSKEKDRKSNDLNINQKINAIFNSPHYVYKADVTITLKNETIKRKIIGKNNVYLITIDNELIPISDIVDIKFSN